MCARRAPRSVALCARQRALQPCLAWRAADATWLASGTLVTATGYASQRATQRVVAAADSSVGSPRRRDTRRGDRVLEPNRSNHVLVRFLERAKLQTQLRGGSTKVTNLGPIQTPSWQSKPCSQRTTREGNGRMQT